MHTSGHGYAVTVRQQEAETVGAAWEPAEMDSDTETQLHTKWSTADLTARLATGTRENDTFVMRVLAARLAADDAPLSDPLHVLKDLAQVADSLAEAVERIVPREIDVDEDFDDADRAVPENTVVALHNAHAGLWRMHQWF